MTSSNPGLKPTLGFIGVLAYGVGDILGAGIYALVGEVAGAAGSYAWMSFLVTLVIAGFTALSYAELSSRIPKSGGEATFCLEAYGKKHVAFLVGWLVLCSGIVSCAAVSVAFSGYAVESISGLNENWKPLFILLFISVVGGIALWGMKQSSVTNIVCTCIEITGLLILLVVGLAYIARDNNVAPVVQTAAADGPALSSILKGSALAFFAFIGFEDIVNVAEETHSPRRMVPKAILTALATAGVLYVFVAWTATTVVPPETLAASNGPLLEVIRIAAPDFPLPLFSLIALFAVANTGMLNLIMGSRLLYGMASGGLVPTSLGKVHSKTHTPYRAILLLCCVVAGLALSGSLGVLAGTTNILLLLVFVSVHVSLIRIQKTNHRIDTPEDDGYVFRVHRIIPWIGAASCAGLIFLVPPRSFITAVVTILIGIALTFTHRRIDNAMSKPE
jgi:amino acid transporter